MPSRQALLVGIGRFSDEGLPPLTSPHEDISALKAILGDKTRGAFDEVRDLADASSQELREALADVANDRHPDDVLLVYFSGHGILNSEGHLLLAAADTRLGRRLSATSLRALDVVRELEESRATSQILILDCCYSGAVGRGSKSALGLPITRHHFGDGRGRVVLTASSTTQLAWEGENRVGEPQPSLFTKLLIEAFTHGGDPERDGEISVDDLFEYASERSRASKSRQTPQRWVFGQSGRILIARNPSKQGSLLRGRVKYQDEATRELSQSLESAFRRRAEGKARGLATGEVDREISLLRAQIREGGHLRAGDLLAEGRYRLLDRIGSGGFASVWHATDLETNTDVAIKVLHSNLGADVYRLKRFWRGAKMMKDTLHESIVQVYAEQCVDGGFYFYVMEYLPRGDLRAAILAGQIVRTDIIPMILRVGAALQCAHDRELIHRDVKPTNILLDAAGVPHLTDFDLVAGVDTQGGSRTGSLGAWIYAPHELVDGRESDHRADVYSLGMTAIFCLYGKDLPLAVMVHTERFIEGLECDVRIKYALRKAVAYDAADRFASVSAFCEALSAALAEPEDTSEIERAYEASEQWDQLIRLLERKAQKAEDVVARVRHLQRIASLCEEKLLEPEWAWNAHTRALQLTPLDETSGSEVERLAGGLVDGWENLANVYADLLGSANLKPVVRATIGKRLARVFEQELADVAKAEETYRFVLTADPTERESLEHLERLYTTLEDWQGLASVLEQRALAIEDPVEKVVLLLRLAWIYEHAGRQPDADRTRRTLAAAYENTRDWKRVFDLLGVFAVESRPPALVTRYLFTQAEICRDKLGDPERAVELFNDTLDHNPSYLEAFESITRLLNQQKAWKQLERAYRKMLHRVAGKGTTDLEHTLWYKLGFVYRDRLQQADTAIEAFKMASVTRPEATVVHQILGELYEVKERWDDGIVEQRILLAADPLAIEPYRALYRLYLHKQAYDEAWCQASAMAFLRKADEEEKRFFDDYRPQGILQVKGRVSNELWQSSVFHPDENVYISKIFEMIAPAALHAKIQQLQGQNKLPVLNKRFRQDPATSAVTFAKTFGWAAQVLGIQAPDLYVRNDVPGAIVAVPASPPASVAGQTVLTGFQPQELTFMCGKHLSHYRGEHYIRTLFPTQAELTIMLFAGVLIVAPNTPMPQDMATQVRATAQELAQHIEPVQLEGLRVVVKRFIDEGAKANIKRWNHAVELTACRAGLIVSGDLEVAKKLLSAEQQLPGDLSPPDKMKELLLYSVSEEYSRVRKAIGVAVAA